MYIVETEFKKLPHIKHAFFTRNGGVSSGIYNSLNAGPGSQDSKENVDQNRDLAMQALGYHNEDLITLYQIHSNQVHVVTESSDNSAIEADAQVTNVKGKVLGILTADCGPVLFADPGAQVIGAAHAGWKGAFSGVLENTIEKMEELGARRNNIHVVLGACIRQASYEVDDSFQQKFIEDDKSNQPLFIPSVKDGHFMFDLAGYILKRLGNLDLASIADIKRDTCAEEESFFSYRRTCLQGDTREYGRLLSAIVLD